MRLIDADRMKENIAIDLNKNGVRFSDLTDEVYEKLSPEEKLKIKILVDWIDAQPTADIERDPIWIERIEYIKELLMKIETVLNYVAY